MVIPVKDACDKEPINFLEELYHYNLGVSIEIITAVAWEIWKKRCDLTHNPQKLTKSKCVISLSLVKWTIGMIEEFKLAAIKTKNEDDMALVQKLVKEEKNFIIVFTYASFDTDKGTSAYGVLVVMDSTGKLIKSGNGSLGILESPFEVELETIAKGVRLVEQMGGIRVLFLSDCKEAINTIKGMEYLMNRAELIMAEEVRRAARKFKGWSFIYIPMTLNGTAHMLAKVMDSPVDSPSGSAPW